MGKLEKRLIQSAVVESIKERKHLNYVSIAKSIDVHPSYIQKVSKQVRTLSYDKFDQLCKQWNVNIADIEQRVQMDREEYLQQKTIVKLMQARGIEFRELAEQSGISALELNHILRERRFPTSEEIQKIANVLQVDVGVIEEGRVETAIKLIRVCLESILFEPSATQAVIDFIEMEL